MSIVKEVAVTETRMVEKVAEKTSRTKMLEEKTAELRRGLENLSKFVYMRLPTADMKTPDSLYDPQVFQMFTERVESFDDLHFCVEPDTGLGFTQIFLHSDDADNFVYTREKNIILYSVNGTIVYKQPIGFAMNVISKAKKEKKEDEAVILGLLGIWIDKSKEEDEEKVEEQKEENLKEKNLKKKITFDDVVNDVIKTLITMYMMIAFAFAMAYFCYYIQNKAFK